LIYFFIFNLFFNFLAFFYDNVKLGGNNLNNALNKKDYIDSKGKPFVNYFSLSKLVKK